MVQLIYSWLLAFRFKTLTAAFVPVLVATGLVYKIQGDTIQWWVSLYALGAAFCIQIATNLFNDAIDFKKGADDETRIGPKRVTQSGLLKASQVWMMALLFVGLALFLGYFLVLRGGFPIVLLGLISLFMAYGYTGGPFPLAYLGLGDLFVILFFGLFAVCGTYFLHMLEVNTASVVAGVQMGFLSTTLIAINNLRDSGGDAKVNKRTLAVRFGDNLVKWEIFALIAITYLLNLFFLVAYNQLYVLLTYVLLPLGGLLVGFVFSVTDKTHLNKALGLAALHQVLFAIIFTLGIVL